MPAVIGQIDRIVRPHMDAVRPRILSLAPRAQKIAVAVKDHDRVFAAVEDIDIVFRVDPDRPDFLERPAVRQFRPVLDDPVFEVASANDSRHALLLYVETQASEAPGPKQSSSPVGPARFERHSAGSGPKAGGGMR